MTTPGGQLTPGDEPEIGDPPQYGVPSGAYVGDASSPQSFKDLNTLTKDKAKRRMQQPLEGMFGRQSNALVLFANSLLGIVQGAINLVVGTVDAIVEGIGAIIESIGSLFGTTRRDMSAVDAARVAAENAIVDNLGDALDQLDEVQRAGGAYMNYPMFTVENGGRTPHVLPLSEPMELQEGTAWIPPWQPQFAKGHYAANQYSTLGIVSGQLELLEPGFWRIDYQAAVLQAASYYAEPAEVWCYVTSASDDRLPVGAPGLDENGNPLASPSHVVTYPRGAGGRQVVNGGIVAFGRAAAYVDQLETGWSGGNTISGTVFALLPSGGYKVSMACSAWEHFSGGASTFVMATKVNSESLRADIETLKTQIAAALPGQSVPLDLDDAAISAMVAQSGQVEAAPVVVPPYEGAGNE